VLAGLQSGIFIILGAAMLQGFTLSMAGILVAYALAFHCRWGADARVSFAAAAATFKGVETVVRRAAGIALVAVDSIFCGRFEERSMIVSNEANSAASEN